VLNCDREQNSTASLGLNSVCYWASRKTRLYELYPPRADQWKSVVATGYWLVGGIQYTERSQGSNTIQNSAGHC